MEHKYPQELHLDPQLALAWQASQRPP